MDDVLSPVLGNAADNDGPDQETAMKDVLSYIDKHRGQWKTMPEQEIALSGYLKNCKSPFMKRSRQHTATSHNGVSLRSKIYRLVHTEKIPGSGKNIQHLFSEGLGVFCDEYLVKTGLRPEPFQADDTCAPPPTASLDVFELDGPGDDRTVRVNRRASTLELRNPRIAQHAPEPEENSPLSSYNSDIGDPQQSSLQAHLKECETEAEVEDADQSQTIDPVLLRSKEVDESEHVSQLQSKQQVIEEPPTLQSQPQSESQKLHLPASSQNSIGLSHTKIKEAMQTLDELIDQVIHSLAPSEAIPMALSPNPPPELEAVYRKVFGKGFWIEKFTFLKPTPTNADLLKSLIAAWILTQVLEKPTPWKLNRADLLSPGSIWSQVQALLAAQDVRFHHILNQAAFQRLGDPEFKAVQLAEHAKVLTDQASVTLWPHISKLSARQQAGLSWRKKLGKAVEHALLLKARIEATPGARVEVLWLVCEEEIRRGTEVLYESTDSSVVGLTMAPGIMVGEGQNELEYIFPAQVIPSEVMR